MKLLEDKLSYKGVCSLVLDEIDVDDEKNFAKVLELLNLLSLKNQYYLELTRADDFLCSESEFEYYKTHLPDFIKNNGKYLVKNRKDDKRFGAIAYLPVNEVILSEFQHIWRYYLSVLFFNPHSTFLWDDFDIKYKKIKPELYGIGYIQNNMTYMTFTKGHDGDNLIITFNTAKFNIEKVKFDIEKIINVC